MSACFFLGSIYIDDDLATAIFEKMKLSLFTRFTCNLSSVLVSLAAYGGLYKRYIPCKGTSQILYSGSSHNNDDNLYGIKSSFSKSFQNPCVKKSNHMFDTGNQTSFGLIGKGKLIRFFRIKNTQSEIFFPNKRKFRRH